MNKVDPPADWPTDGEGCTVGNPYSPVLVIIPGGEAEGEGHVPRHPLAAAAIDAGAAGALLLTSPNVGIERVICNTVSNPNVRYLLIAGPDNASASGSALLSLCLLGEDLRRHIEGAASPDAAIPDVPAHVFDRFRTQVTALDMLGDVAVEALAEVVLACCGNFGRTVRLGEVEHDLRDLGAVTADPLHWRPPTG